MTSSVELYYIVSRQSVQLEIYQFSDKRKQHDEENTGRGWEGRGGAGRSGVSCDGKTSNETIGQLVTRCTDQRRGYFKDRRTACRANKQTL